MKLLLFLTVSFSGLVAGLLYAYSCSVNPGLKALANADYIKAMQAINAAIQTPFFFVSFAGLLVLFPAAAYLSYRQQSPLFSFLAAALLVYFIGVFGITAFCNVPLNNQLAGFSSDAATAGELAAVRQTFETPWNTYHSIRTAAAFISFALTLFPLVKNIQE